MSAPLAWVIGQGGLLGSHLATALRASSGQAECWAGPVEPFQWDDPVRLTQQFEVSLGRFAAAIAEAKRPWIIAWAAGAVVVGSAPATLTREEETWALFLGLLERRSWILGDQAPGLLFLASSAGGVYGNSRDQPITESSACLPISDYGRAKLRMEATLAWRAQGRPYLIGRFSNLFGVGQNLRKRQGLISYLSRCLIYNVPAHIYVPLDTTRDYLFAPDAAHQVVQHLLHPGMGHGDARIKLFVDGRPASVGRIVGIFRRIARRSPRMIMRPIALGRNQPRMLAFRSVFRPELPSPLRTDLDVGIALTHQHQRALFAQGRLPPPERI